MFNVLMCPTHSSHVTSQEKDTHFQIIFNFLYYHQVHKKYSMKESKTAKMSNVCWCSKFSDIYITIMFPSFALTSLHWWRNILASCIRSLFKRFIFSGSHFTKKIICKMFLDFNRSTDFNALVSRFLPFVVTFQFLLFSSHWIKTSLLRLN